MCGIRYLAFSSLLLTAATSVTALAQNNSKEIMSREAAALIAVISKSDAPVFEKAKACQRLAVVGSADAIPALAALLGDETMNLYARTGLEGIPDPAVDVAFREAAQKLQGRPLIGVVNSIGKRRDVRAVELLQKMLGNKDAAVAAAAARALGRIGGSESATVLRTTLAKEGTDKTSLADACLICAEERAAAGNTAEALALYEAVAKEIVPKYLKVAALQGQLRLQGANAKDLLIQQIRSADDEFFNLGLSAARNIPGADVTEALTAELDKLTPPRQARLLLVLGQRKEPPSISLLQTLSKSKSIPVREAAIAVLSKIGGAAAVETLLEAALGDDEVSQLARDRLKKLASAEADRAITNRLPGADTRTRVVLIELIGARRIVAAAPAIRSALDDTNESVKSAAIAAFGQLVSLNDLDLLTSRALKGANSAETTAAQSALTTAAMRMSDRDACATKLAASLPGASVPGQVFLLELLTKISGPKALATVVDSAKSNDPTIKDAATRVLGEWPDADAAPALLDISKNEKDAKYKVRALRGYLRIARQLQLPDDARVAMFRTAMEVAMRDEEKQLALDILTRIPSVATLELAVAHLREPTLTNAAADAATKIAPKVVGSDPKAVVSAMQKILDAGVSGNVGNRAKQLLAQAKGSG